ncbi:MAG: hydrolase [Methylococcales bacterium]
MIISSSFKPAWWLPHAHLQTLWPALVSRGNGIVRQRERIQTPDNDFLDVDWCGLELDSSNSPLVIIMHGLAGSSRSDYVTGLQEVLENQGWRSAALNFRGCSGTPNRAVRGYHSGETDDIHFLYQVLREREPQTPLFVVGYSLGGNVLLKWMGEQQTLDLVGAVAVSVPFRLDLCADHMNQGFSRSYQYRLLRHMRSCVNLRLEYFQQNGLSQQAEQLQALGQLSNYVSFRDIDHYVTAPLHDYHSADDYYQRCSSRAFLGLINRPTLIIQAQDDPFMTKEVVPHDSELSVTTTLELSASGGHIGFIEGSSPARIIYWLDQRISEWLGRLIG